jgi:tetratricopeptide (TPR) repeat protein
VDAWLKLADVNRRMGDVSEAIENVKRAEKLDPENKNIAVKEAQLLLDQKDNLQAAEKAIAMLEKDKNNDEARIILAQAHAREGQFEQALSTLKQKQNGEANNPRLSLETIRIRKEYEGAETVLPELIVLAKSNPENPRILTFLTDLLIQTNRLDEAQKTAQTILRILPQEAEVHLMLGRLQRKNGQLDQAIAHLSDAIAYEPGLVEAYIELGKTYQDRRDLEEAIKVFKKGAEANPADHRPYYFAGLALKECKDYAGAEAMLHQAKHNAPNDPDIIRQLGVITAMNLINHLRKTS